MEGWQICVQMVKLTVDQSLDACGVLFLCFGSIIGVNSIGLVSALVCITSEFRVG